MKLGYGELALKEETDGMAEINLWDLIVVKLSELGILKRYIIYKLVITGYTKCTVLVLVYRTQKFCVPRTSYET